MDRSVERAIRAAYLFNPGRPDRGTRSDGVRDDAFGNIRALCRMETAPHVLLALTPDTDPVIRRAPSGAAGANHPGMRLGVSNDEHGEGLREVVDRLQGEVSELRRSRKRIAQAAHADRRAIERALHDGVQQHLIALAVDVRRLGGLMDGDPLAAKTLLDEMAANVRQAVDETMELALMVYPPLLEARGFAAALRSAGGSAGVTAQVDVPAGARYPAEIATAVYWSWVEALSSAPRGSQATVSMRDEDGVLTFEIAVVGHHPEGRLDRLRDRIEALDGGVSVDDRQDGGSRVHGWLPSSGGP